MLAGIYQHYNGSFYQCLGIAAHAVNDERMVVYVKLDSALPGPRLRVIPLSDWLYVLEWPDGLMRPRFCYLGTERDPATLQSEPG